jgi:uncharacterized RDD family membrane protein YckC
MERGSQPPDSPNPAPGPEAPAGPQAPAPGPQAPAPGPQAPAPGPQAPGYAPPGPESAPSYGGPVPPGGWQQPIARPTAGWEGKPLASWGSRVAAWFIDILVVLIPVVLLALLIFGGTVDEDSSAWEVVGASILYFLLFSAVVLLYAPLLMMRRGENNGKTLGKQMIGIRVVRDSGQPMSFGWGVFRDVVIKSLAVGIASSIIPFIPWILDNFWPLWDSENRALHDMAASTHVVRT